MILGFTKAFDGKQLNFIEKISSGIKKHTLREDVHGRWREGRVIQFATGVRTKQYKEHFQKPCTWVQSVKLVLPQSEYPPYIADLNIFIDGVLLNPLRNQEFSRNDGFTAELDFLKWFFFEKKNGEWKQVRTSWSGRMIHWTDINYVGAVLFRIINGDNAPSGE